MPTEQPARPSPSTLFAPPRGIWTDRLFWSLIVADLCAAALLFALTCAAKADPAPVENGYYWIYNYPGMPGHEWAVGRWDAEFRIWIVPDDEPFEHDSAMTVGPRLYAPAPPA